jgi:hypothetical protein
VTQGLFVFNTLINESYLKMISKPILRELVKQRVKDAKCTISQKGFLRIMLSYNNTINKLKRKEFDDLIFLVWILQLPRNHDFYSLREHTAVAFLSYSTSFLPNN